MYALLGKHITYLPRGPIATVRFPPSVRFPPLAKASTALSWFSIITKSETYKISNKSTTLFKKKEQHRRWSSFLVNDYFETAFMTKLILFLQGILNEKNLSTTFLIKFDWFFFQSADMVSMW